MTYLPVGPTGLISLADLEEAMRPDTVLVSVMFVNNEIGVEQPIKEIGKSKSKTIQLYSNCEVKCSCDSDNSFDVSVRYSFFFLFHLVCMNTL